MVRTYSTVNASTSRIGELFDLVARESDPAAGRNGLAPSSCAASTIDPQSRPVSDISLGPSCRNASRPNSVPLETRIGWRMESAVEGEPVILQKAVFGGNDKSPFEDYERQLRIRDHQQRRLYLGDLRKQLEEQREQRLKTEIAFGGHEFEKELLKHHRQRGASYSPSRDRSNGVGETSSNSISAGRFTTSGLGYKSGNDYEKYLRAAELQHKREYAAALLNQQQQQPQYDYDYRSRTNGLAGGYTPTFASGTESNSVPLSASFVRRREQSVPNGLNLFHNVAMDTGGNYDSSSLIYGRNACEFGRGRGRGERQSPLFESNEIYDPWGKGGAGAPIRDRNGRLITDRRMLQKSWTTMLDSNLPHDFSPNRRSIESTPLPMNGISSFPASNPIQKIESATIANEKDFYKQELRKQMEEQKRLKELEKEKRRLEDERDRMRIERETERQRREMEEERRKQQEKSERALRRTELARARNGTMENLESNKYQNPDGKRKPPDDGLEWWERQPETSLLTRSSSTNAISERPLKSAATIDEKSSNHRRSISIDNAKNRSIDRRYSSSPVQSNENAREASRTTSALARNEQIMRQLSAMRERLNKEQMRVRSAIRRRERDEDIFEDDKDDDVRITSHASRSKSIDRSSRFSPVPTLVSHRRTTTNDDEDDPPLVKLIKNSRTLDSTISLRRPSAQKLSNSRNGRNLLTGDDGEERRSYRTRRVNGFNDQSPDSDNPDGTLDNFLHHRNTERRNFNGY